ncbi:virion structural protein [Bordetella phage CN1]|uniref:Virion structural protein n=1 Tax=Bordetella phage CN1 TaxID=1916123 RepID=A0A2D0W9Y0_9CAUD|nr:tail protein [Bordetella phage CN1]APL99456.1 virion structural protein [Bordetella phage CN1]
MVLCHGPVDRLQRIDVDDRTAWAGFNQGGRININNPNLFGGESREGGVSGPVDILMGETGQGKNDYLVAKLGAQVPSFRGVVSAVLRQCYLGMNPYLKPWSFRVQRILKRGGGQAQWYPTKASIGTVNRAALYFALDVSNSMAGERLANLKTAITSVLEAFLGVGPSSQMDIRVVAFGETSTSITRYNVGTSDVQAIIDWVNSRTVTGGTNYATGMGGAPGFFANTGSKPRYVFFMTDGEPFPTSSAADAVAIRDGLPPTEVYCFNIDLADTTYTRMLDNTPRDGVPIVPGGDPAPLANAVMSALFVQLDMNPAHIIRECLTDTEWGMGYLEADLDDVSFRAAADRLHQEQMGMSLLWTKQTEIEEFIKEVLKHINAVVRVNRRTGKFELKLIRDDYDEETLLELNPGNIERLTDFSRPSFGELVNSVTVNYWDPVTGGDASLTVQDIALSEAQRAVVNTTLQYPGFTNNILASRVAERDLRTLSSPLVSCVIYTDTIAKDLGVGDVFKLVWPDYLIAGMVMRVTQIAYGNGRSNKIKITCTQDVFALPETVAFEPEPPVWVDPDGPPVAVQNRLAQEMPYYELVQRVGQTGIQAELDNNPEMGYVMVSGVRPNTAAISARLASDGGSGLFEDIKSIDFSPGATLASPVSRGDTVFVIQDGVDLDLVNPGTWAYIGTEMVAVVAVDSQQGLLQVQRAILDTVPVEHEAGELIIFADEYAENDETEYVQSDTVQVSILTVTGQGTLPLGSAPVDTVEINARAVRPYRPGNVRLNGELYPQEDGFPSYPLNLTWSHRNRILETVPTFTSWSDGNVTLEPGVSYRIDVYALDENKQEVGFVGSIPKAGTETSAQVDGSMIESAFPGSPWARVEVWATRDGWDSWQSVQFIVRGPLMPPSSLQAQYVSPTPPEITGFSVTP